MAKNKLDAFKKALGYDGKKFNEEKALTILEEMGVHATNFLGETPLIIAAYLERVEILKKIIDKVDDVDYKVNGAISGTALMEACEQRRLESIKLLIEAGANLEQKDKFGLTPLSKIFTNTFSDPIPSATYLASNGAKINDKVLKMGLSWNKEKFTGFLKNIGFKLDYISTHNDENSGVEKEPNADSLLDIQHLHNIVNEKDYFKTAKLIWQKLVPKSGQASSVQGELLRAIEKLRDEAQRNGNVNFNKNCHGILIEYLRQVLVDETLFERKLIDAINQDLDRLTEKNSPCIEDEIYDNITKRIIDWYLKNPAQVFHMKNDKLYC